MPITSPFPLPRLSTDEFRALDYKIMKLAFACQTDIGRLADETIYQADFAARLVAEGYEVYREFPISASFGSFVKYYYPDVVVAGKGIYELKTITRLTAKNEGQVINYLLLLDCGHAKLINFRPASVETRFVNAPMTLAQRRAFVVNDRGWQGNETAKEWLLELLRDWGTCLELPLYYQAIVHHLGGDVIVIKQFPMHRGDVSLGNQRFHLIQPNEAFRITAFGEVMKGYDLQLKRLLRLSPLKTMHWINIGHEEVTFTSIS